MDNGADRRSASRPGGNSNSGGGAGGDMGGDPASRSAQRPGGASRPGSSSESVTPQGGMGVPGGSDSQGSMGSHGDPSARQRAMGGQGGDPQSGMGGQSGQGDPSARQRAMGGQGSVGSQGGGAPNGNSARGADRSSRGTSSPRSTTGNASVRGNSGGSNVGGILGILGIGALIARFKGNSSGSGNNRGGGDKVMWQPWAFLALLVLFGVFYKEKIPFVYDRSLEENMNQFLVGVEGTNKYPYEESRTGLSVYDKNRIKYDQMYEMGDKQYFVYVYSGDPERDAELNAAVELYESKKDHIPVYKLKYLDLLDSNDNELTMGDSKIFEMFRINQKADIIGTYKTLADWKVMWPDEKK